VRRGRDFEGFVSRGIRFVDRTEGEISNFAETRSSVGGFMKGREGCTDLETLAGSVSHVVLRTVGLWGCTLR